MRSYCAYTDPLIGFERKSVWKKWVKQGYTANNVGRGGRNRGRKGMGSISTPREVASNFSAVVAPRVQGAGGERDLISTARRTAARSTDIVHRTTFHAGTPVCRSSVHKQPTTISFIRQHGRPHIGANGVSCSPFWKNG